MTITANAVITAIMTITANAVITAIMTIRAIMAITANLFIAETICITTNIEKLKKQRLLLLQPLWSLEPIWPLSLWFLANILIFIKQEDSAIKKWGPRQLWVNYF